MPSFPVVSANWTNSFTTLNVVFVLKSPPPPPVTDALNVPPLNVRLAPIVTGDHMLVALR